MRFRVLPFIVAAVALVVPSAAAAYFAHTISRGESLYSIAAADGLSVGQLAAANGLSAGSQLITGRTLQIPPRSAGATSYAAPASTGEGAAQTCDGDGDSDDVGCATAVASPTGSVASSGGGSYVVQPGDTLSAIAARAGISVSSLAAANGINPRGVLLSGRALRLAGSPAATYVSTGSAATSQPVGASAQGSVTGPPYPTPERLSASTIGQVAANQGVSPSLADAIAWQESGFNNDLVSSSDARGIMQILPGTWQYIQDSLNPGTPLAPASAIDNVRGGALLLRSLLNSTGGDSTLAAAGYYQGLPSVERHGMFRDTQQYVRDVMMLRQEFGGG